MDNAVCVDSGLQQELQIFLQRCSVLMEHGLALLGSALKEYLGSLEQSVLSASNALDDIARGGPQPHLTWSSSMPQDADVVMFFGDAIKPYNKDIQTRSQLAKKARPCCRLHVRGSLVTRMNLSPCKSGGETLASCLLQRA